MTNSIIIKPIGTIYSPYIDVKNMPIQPLSAGGTRGWIEIFPEFIEGLKDLDGFSHITLLYYFHKINSYDLSVVPFMDDKPHGIFATRSPKRPNAIGMSTVKLLDIENNILHIESIDVLNETPLIDIKPFFERFDNREGTKSGWLEKHLNTSDNNLRSDERFKN